MTIIFDGRKIASKKEKILREKWQALGEKKNKKLPLSWGIKHSAAQPSTGSIPETRSNYGSAAAVELWLSVPRSLGVWLCRLLNHIFFMRRCQGEKRMRKCRSLA